MKKVLLILIIIPFFISCSGKLTRSKAKKQIIEVYKYPKPVTREITIYDNTFGKSGTVYELKKFKKLGLLDYTDTGNYRRRGSVRATLTEKGKKYYIRDARSNSMEKNIIVKVAELHFDKVTGIKFNNEKNTAYVEYEVRQTNITPFGQVKNILRFKDIEDKVIKKTAYFEKFDDGWRIHKKDYK